MIMLDRPIVSILITIVFMVIIFWSAKFMFLAIAIIFSPYFIDKGISVKKVSVIFTIAIFIQIFVQVKQRNTGEMLYSDTQSLGGNIEVYAEHAKYEVIKKEYYIKPRIKAKDAIFIATSIVILTTLFYINRRKKDEEIYEA